MESQVARFDVWAGAGSSRGLFMKRLSHFVEVPAFRFISNCVRWLDSQFRSVLHFRAKFRSMGQAFAVRGRFIEALSTLYHAGCQVSHATRPRTPLDP